MAIGSDTGDLDIDFDADVDFDLDLDADVDVAADISVGETTKGPLGILDWIGIKEVPVLIWLVSFLSFFGLTGLILQSVSFGIFGGLIPGLIASILVLFPAMRGAKFLASTLATIMPKHESSAVSKRFLGGHHGTITQGTAKRGKPAEAKIKDRHGNTHYLRVEPLDDKDEIPQGRSVHVIRKRNGMFFVVDIS